MPFDKIWATVYEDDDEAVEIWKKLGLPEERIVRLGREDNFWEIGLGPAAHVQKFTLTEGLNTAAASLTANRAATAIDILNSGIMYSHSFQRRKTVNTAISKTKI